MRKKIWFHKADSFSSADEFDRVYYSSMTAEERLETVQILRERYDQLKEGTKRESRKRLRRVLRVTEQT